MTPEERANPQILNGSRRQRIARGSGTSIQEVNRLIRQFEDMRKVMRIMSDPVQMARLLRNMPKMPGRN
ncbi:MAG: hypothetical protein NZM25_10265, partial [Leptospiraceae bacterium]|nr:hypothetical protein [Leptospiraceae bacterium]